GVKPRADQVIEIDPLAPADWPWFALDDLPYHGRRLSVIWDKDGRRYRQGKGFHLLVDGQKVASLNQLGKLTAKLPAGAPTSVKQVMVNYVVNNDGDYYPQINATFSHERAPLARLNDGNYWYHLHPPNRWTTEGSPNATDSIEVNLGVQRAIDNVKLLFLDDGEKVVAPERFDVDYWNGQVWAAVPRQVRTPAQPTGHCANVVAFPTLGVQKLRITFTHGKNGRTGLTELEAWGKLTGEYQIAPPPAGNLALNLRGQGFPKASASFHDVFGGVPRLANDGKTVYRSNPINRWTSYGSTNATDWLEVDLGEPKEIGRIELCLYDDRGGVQPPEAYTVETWSGTEWREAPDQVKTPARPAGSAVNTVTFTKATTAKFRVVFTHKGKS
ncbi:MAG: discoidin domain-containing protein, partial [Desulfobacterales bacterium]|nr:discoidin domain-containing protein [Desulfobacterales bacterium]